MHAWISEAINYPNVPLWLVLVGIVMYVTWSVAYLLIIIECFKRQTYGLPLASICLNIVWETIFAFDLIADLPIFFNIGNFSWFILDVVIVYQLFKYGRRQQTIPFMRENFTPVVAVTLLFSAIGLPTFMIYFNDVNGVISSFFMNFSMSILFISMLAFRPRAEGLLVSAAVFKAIGTLTGGIFTIAWWPVQFENGLLIREPHVQQPTGQSFLIFLVAGIFVIDVIYITLLHRRKKAIEAGEPVRIMAPSWVEASVTTPEVAATVLPLDATRAAYGAAPPKG